MNDSDPPDRGRRRGHHVNGGVGDERLTRPVRVALAEFEDFGSRGTPAGMRGSAKSRAVHGEIDTGGPAPGREGPVAQGGSRPRSRTVVWAASGLLLLLLVLIVVIVLVSWWWADSEPAPTCLEPVQVEERAEPAVAVEVDRVRRGPDEVVALEPVERAPVELAPERDNSTAPDVVSSAKAPAVAAEDTPECRAHRARAARARRDGEWATLERLTRRMGCWGRASVSKNQATALRMRALFELDRYSECIDVGASAESKEITKWANNCRRAL